MLEVKNVSDYMPLKRSTSSRLAGDPKINRLINRRKMGLI